MTTNELARELNKPPRYKHDCNMCVYLGHYGRFDLYACPKRVLTVEEQCARDDLKQFELGTIIARVSSEPSDYASGYDSSLLLVPQELDYLKAMQHALQRALMMDFFFSDNELILIGKQVVRSFKPTE